MKIGIRLFRDTATDLLSGLGGAANPISLGLGVLQEGIGIVQDIKSKKKINTLLGQQQSYRTPQEVYDVLNLTKANQQGFDSTTLNYLTGQTDQAFSSGLDTLFKTNGDPNDLSALFGQKIDAIMKIGAESHQIKTQQFSQLISAYDSVAANKAAEQKSQQDLLKNKLQAAGVQLQSATGNISGGVNTILSTLAAIAQGDLYNTKTPPLKEYSTNNTTGYNPTVSSVSDSRTRSPITIGG